MDWISKYDGVI
jgi:hypothetical protein